MELEVYGQIINDVINRVIVWNTGDSVYSHAVARFGFRFEGSHNSEVQQWFVR